MNCNFTFAHYAEMIRLGTSNGYEFLLASDLFEKPAPIPPFIVLGHDVDHLLDIANVRQLMEVEREAGVRSTWYFRLHANYNPLFYKNYEVIQLLLKSGHEVGIHFDTDFYGLFKPEHDELKVDRDVAIFKRVIGSKPKVANIHNKSGAADGGVFSEAIFKSFGIRCTDYTILRKLGLKYLSDSSHAWREGCLCSWIEKGEPKLYVTIHPSWRHRRSSCENY